MSIRIAIIGAGLMGADHARIVARVMPGTTLQITCDVGTARANLVEDRNGAADVTEPDFYETPKGVAA